MKQNDGGGREVAETRDNMFLQSMKKERRREREREKEGEGERETERLGERSDLIQLTKMNHVLPLPCRQTDTHTHAAAVSTK